MTNLCQQDRAPLSKAEVQIRDQVVGTTTRPSAHQRQVSDQIVRVLHTDADRRTSESEMPMAARCASGMEAWVMMAGCSIRLSTPPRLSASKQLRPFEDIIGRRETAFHEERHDAAEAGHLFLRQRVLGVAFEAGVDHARDLGMSFRASAAIFKRVAAVTSACGAAES